MSCFAEACGLRPQSFEELQQGIVPRDTLGLMTFQSRQRK